MKVIFDSSCWIEYFAGSENCESYSNEIIKTEKIILPSIIIYEVFKKILIESNEDAAISLIGHLRECEIIDIDFYLLILAAKLGKEFKLPFADSLVVAVAKIYNATIYTHDAHSKDLSSNVRYIEKYQS